MKCGNCKDNHPTVSAVRECYAGRHEHVGGPGWSDSLDTFRADYVSGAAHVRQATVAARRGEAAPVATLPRKVVESDGMYRNPDTGEIYKVQWNRASGDGHRLYAKKMFLDFPDGTLGSFELTGDRVPDGKARFEYAPGGMKIVRPEWKMTLEEAKAFGALYGTCVRCGRTLTLEESIERAMGRICAGKADYWA